MIFIHFHPVKTHVVFNYFFPVFDEMVKFPAEEKTEDVSQFYVPDRPYLFSEDNLFCGLVYPLNFELVV